MGQHNVAVIGAGFGVQLADGRRHVFSHFGSGTLMDVPTYLSEYFIVEPKRFLNEYAVLKMEMDANPEVIIHANALLTTPWDVYLNRAKEKSLGINAHGSVGAGINETITRNVQVQLKVSDIYTKPLTSFFEILAKIRYNFRLTCEELGFDSGDEYNKLLQEDALTDFWHCLQEFNNLILLVFPDKVKLFLSQYSLVFEGAQGLMLDEHFGSFPHVTRSRTGSINITNILRSIGQDLDETIYVTRCYSTRHGNGPFHNSPIVQDSMNIVDPTNYPNDWQGEMRFGMLDTYQLAKFINMDKAYCHSTIRTLAVTCMDQVAGNHYYCNDAMHQTEYMFMYNIHWRVQLDGYYVGRGPTVDDMSDYDFKQEYKKYDKGVDRLK